MGSQQIKAHPHVHREKVPSALCTVTGSTGKRLPAQQERPKIFHFPIWGE